MNRQLTYPQNWLPARYELGQRSKQGIIIGAYYAAFGWNYLICIEGNFTHFHESEIIPLTQAELKTEIEKELNFHTQQMARLQLQLQDF